MTGARLDDLSFFVLRASMRGSTPVVDPATGDDATAPDEAGASGGWTPMDPRDPVTPATAGAPGPEHTLTPKSIAIQKGVAVVVGNGARTCSPGDLLEYTLRRPGLRLLRLSNLVVTDVFSDGQRLEGTPRLTATRHGSTSPIADVDGGNWSALVDSPGTGSTTLSVNLSDELVTRGFDVSGRLLGGCVPAGGTGGPPPDCSVFDGGATTVTLTFQTRIQDQFTDTFPSGDPSVDQGDPLGNTVTVNGDLLSVADLSSLGASEADGSGAGVTIPRGALSKTIYAVNGSTSLPAPLEVFPGDTVTYRLRYTLPTSDFEDLLLTDYLPLPIFDAAEVTVFDASSGGAPSGLRAPPATVRPTPSTPGAPSPRRLPSPSSRRPTRSPSPTATSTTRATPPPRSTCCSR